MSERSHPERRSTEVLRPTAKLVIARDLTLQDAAHWDRERKQKGATNEWLTAVENYIVDVFTTDSDYAESLGEVIKTKVAIHNGISWRNTLQYAQGKPSDSYFGSESLINPRYFSEKIEDPQFPKSIIEVATAEAVTSAFVRESVARSGQIFPEYNQKELEKMRNKTESIEDYIDYQLAMGEVIPDQDPDYLMHAIGWGYLPGKKGEEVRIRESATTQEFMRRSDAFLDFETKLKVAARYEATTARTEALDWVLGEEDENNGLAQLLAKQKTI